MARVKQQPQDDEQGAPEWMVTFSDCMTLLLTFFVLLLTFSSFDERIYRKLNVIYCDAFSSIYSRRRASKEALAPREQIQYTVEIEKGSEKPTLEDGSNGLLKVSLDQDFKKHKVFLIDSEKIFWAKGTRISQQGQKTLSLLAEFLKKVPARVVISENSSNQNEHGHQLGLSRAWSVIEYLQNNHKIEKNRFSISAATTLGSDGFSLLDLNSNPGALQKTERMLEIVLLESGLYN